MLNPFPYHRIIVDRVVARHVHKLPGAIREDAITIYIRRDGTVYFGNSKIRRDDLSDMVRDAVRNGAEKRIYLELDAHARYGEVNVLLHQIQRSGIENVSLIAETPRPAAAPSSPPTP